MGGFPRNQAQDWGRIHVENVSELKEKGNWTEKMGMGFQKKWNEVGHEGRKLERFTW